MSYDLDNYRNSPCPLEVNFTRYWDLFVDDILTREGFKPFHLEQLRVLCELFVEVDELTRIVKEEGYTYYSEGGRNGDQLKIRPEISQLNRTRTEIRNYCKILCLTLEKGYIPEDDTENGDAF